MEVLSNIIIKAFELLFSFLKKPRIVPSAKANGSWAGGIENGLRRYDYRLTISLQNRSDQDAFEVRIPAIQLLDKRASNPVMLEDYLPKIVKSGETEIFEYEFSILLPVDEPTVQNAQERFDEIQNKLSLSLAFENKRGKLHRKEFVIIIMKSTGFEFFIL